MFDQKYTILFLAICLVVQLGCGHKKVNRDYIPIIKENLYKLQVAVKDQNHAQIDSLLSVKIIQKKQSSDSLLEFIYRPDNSFNFFQFGNAEIVYTNENARIDCYLMDSTSAHDRPFVLFLVNEHDMWLFSSFQEQSMTDSLQLD